MNTINSIKTKMTENKKELTENLGSKKLGRSDRQESKEKMADAKEVLLSQNPVVQAGKEIVKQAVKELVKEGTKQVIREIVKEAVTNVPQKIEQMAPPETDSGIRYKQPDMQ